MSDAYVKNGELHIAVGSEDWEMYCELLKKKLEGLEEQKRAIEEKIAEIHRIMNPTPVAEVIETQVSAPIQQKCEKYLLVKDIACKYKVTVVSVEAACRGNLIPYHWNGATKESRFTPEDVEKITSIQSRKKVFTPTTETKKAEPKPRAFNGKRFLTSNEANRRLGIGWLGSSKLREAGILTAKVNEDGKCNRYEYDEDEISAVMELAKEVGGIDKLVQSCMNK